MSSRLFQEVREKRGLAYSVGSYTVGYADTGQVGIYLGTREDNLATACEVIGAELRAIGETPIPAAELRRAKDHLKGRLVLSMESTGHAHEPHRALRPHRAPSCSPWTRSWSGSRP